MSRGAGRRWLGGGLFATLVTLFFLSVAGQRVEHDAGLATLYAIRGDVEPPREAIVIALDQKSSDWLAFHAGDPRRVSDILPRCLPETTRAALARLRNVSDMPRGVHACLLDVLGRRGARLVAFDILFNVETPDDAVLAEAITAGPPTILFERIRGAVEQGVAGSGPVPPQRISPRPLFASAAAATASFLVNAPSGNMVEGYVTSIRDFPDLATMPEVALALWRDETPTERARAEEGGRPIWLYGPPRTLPTWTLREVFARDTARPLPEDLSNRAVFVGVSDPEFLGTRDHFKIPVSDARRNDIGGVELAATAFLNLLHGDRLVRLPTVTGAVVVFLAVAGTILGTHMLGGWRGLMVAGAAALAYAALAIGLFIGAQIWIPIATPLFIAIPVVMVSALVDRYALARRMVERLAPRPVASHLLDRFDEAARQIRTEAATVLFTDIVGSTDLGDRLAPAEYSEIINTYYQRATEAVEAHRGMVVEFMGDGIIAVFTESVTGNDHAAQGCAAALALGGAIRQANAENGAGRSTLLRLRMGVHSGVTSTGGMGAEHRYNFKVLGDAVNTAARLEQLGKQFDDGASDVILISEDARIASGRDEAEFEALGAFALRGKHAPIRVLRLHESTRSRPVG